ncbi:CheB methylesterase domain-containing protein [Plastorhodobacter daqingensis]|uniref:protein-glutamate methylesterase n=1 Tax=Plastorhodobacter daqingensis TaxID=1387281 RepID=A0ABW2UME1_9RHOB
MPRKILLIDRRPIRSLKLAEALKRQPDLVVLDAVVSLPVAFKSQAIDQVEAVVLVMGGPADSADLERARPEIAQRRLSVLALPESELDAGRTGTGSDEFCQLAARIGDRLRQTQGAGAVGLPAENLPLVCIGASTGGLTVLEQILASFPADCPPTLIVQHIRGSFSAGLADRLNRISQPEVMEAWTGAPIQRGRVYLAPGDQHHLEFRPQPVPQCRLVSGEKVTGHRPSVDALFRSVEHRAAPGVAVLLTGMGRDGAQGLLSLRQRGWHTIAQDEGSSTVYGMPRVAAELGAAEDILPDRLIGNAILRACTKIAQKRTSALP